MIDTPPSPDEVEVSVFGPGIGESIVVHIGNGHWLVVDSCIDRQTGLPIALKYFERIGVNAATQIKLVVASHWHDDHIQGLASVLRAAPNAKFVSSAVHQLQQLAQVAKLGVLRVPQTSATKEIDAIIKVLEARRGVGERRDTVGPVPAIANKRLVALEAGPGRVTADVYALSPADALFNVAEAELRDALLSIANGRRPRRPGANQLSVTLWVRVGCLDVLLGADLENAPASNEGWNAIVSSRERPPGRAGFFKVPHHGSMNAHSADCWTELVQSTPIAAVTPYSPSNLPSISDARRLCALTSNVYLTSDPGRYGVPRRDNAVEKTLREMAVRRRALVGPTGHVRFRCDAFDPTAEPAVVLRDGARKLCA